MRNYLIMLLFPIIWSCQSSKRSVQSQDANTSSGEVSVKVDSYTGKHHSHNKQKEIDKNSNFNLRQAQNIVQENIENRDKHEKHRGKRKEKMQVLLHALNFKESKSDIKKERVSYTIY